MRLHLDTDFAGDADDACALAMILGWPNVELVGITTSADVDGQRAGYVARILELAGRDDIPIAAGSGLSLTTGEPIGGVPDHDTYWDTAVAPRPAPPGAALDLIARSVELGATIAVIGSCTNLALLGAEHLSGLRVVLMGGWMRPPAGGLPAWGPEMDRNVQCDTDAALTVASCADFTLVTLPATMKAHLRESDLPRLAASGPIGELLARQAKAHGAERGMAELGRAHAGLPDDLLNFQYDAVACAVALGWPGAVIEEMRLRPVLEDGVMRFEPNEDGRQMRVVTDIDGDGFAETWMESLEAAQRGVEYRP